MASIHPSLLTSQADPDGAALAVGDGVRSPVANATGRGGREFACAVAGAAQGPYKIESWPHLGLSAMGC